MGKPLINRTGLRYGSLLVIERAPKPADRRDTAAYWLCKCDCTPDRYIIANGSDLARGNTTSCGCKNPRYRRGGDTLHPMWDAWSKMHKRCKDPRSPKYKDYGARGITIDSRWDDFRTFLQDMGERPEGMTLGRIDNDGNYGPHNCRWETDEEQQNNTRKNHMITAFGRTQTLMQWSQETGIDYSALRNRIKLGWPPEKMLTTQVRSGKRFKAFGRKQTVVEWAREFNMPLERLRGRLAMGWPLEKALTDPASQRSRAKDDRE